MAWGGFEGLYVNLKKMMMKHHSHLPSYDPAVGLDVVGVYHHPIWAREELINVIMHSHTISLWFQWSWMMRCWHVPCHMGLSKNKWYLSPVYSNFLIGNSDNLTSDFGYTTSLDQLGEGGSTNPLCNPYLYERTSGWMGTWISKTYHLPSWMNYL